MGAVKLLAGAVGIHPGEYGQTVLVSRLCQLTIQIAIAELPPRTVVLALPGDPLHPEKQPVWPHRTRVVAEGAGRFVSAKR